MPEHEYSNRPKYRQLRSVTITEDDLRQRDQLQALRLATRGITTRPWTDAEWAGWVRRWLPQVAHLLRQLDNNDDQA